jgi:hypothetical protein
MDTSAKILGLNMTFDSALFHALALAAAERCDGKGNFDALAAVILAYTSLESFLNEVAQLPRTLLDEETRQDARYRQIGVADPHRPVLERLALEMRDAQDQRASVEERYDLAWKVLTGTAIAKGENHRQLLTMLTKLRNDLVHKKSDESEIVLRSDPDESANFDGIWLGKVVQQHKCPQYFQFFKDKGLLAEGDNTTPWLYRVCTRGIAEWACETVQHLADDLVDHSPERSEFRDRLEKNSLARKSSRQLY